uniref:VQ motif-containing family protein n=1 Tax=Rhizophora mucronata TaxID=61149 RepID=A0A2P2NM42_RHIMU
MPLFASWGFWGLPLVEFDQAVEKRGLHYHDVDLDLILDGQPRLTDLTMKIMT